MSDQPKEPKSKWAKPADAEILHDLQMREFRTELNNLMGKYMFSGIEPLMILMVLFNAAISFAMTICKPGHESDILDGVTELFETMRDAAKETIPVFDELRSSVTAGSGDKELSTEDLIKMLRGMGIIKEVKDDDDG
ncbi:MAG: hypothetical protein ACXABY_25570 [Candidatus Thorarchaeota archaeon]|jgi:hypothetical protein